ncbi:MAG: hypothetical protein LQ346_007354 [Caloplaca aetnensis]|nr:MAG: hypothetical protein LQ346_007354 [Caloplaca aetnensis]
MADWIAPVSAIKRYGLTEVFRPTDGADVDIVFVHGLNGHPHRTWASDKSDTFWPAELLPAVIGKDKARLLVYGYDADLTSTANGLSKDKIHNHAEQLVAVLSASRRKAGATERPIIFVAHSVGGIIVKRAIIHSSGIRGHQISHLRSIFVSTFGILFLGTPHMGSDVAKWSSWLNTIYSSHCLNLSDEDESYLITALETGSETLQTIERDFVQSVDRFHIYYFHEGKPTDLGGTFRYIVDELSASPVISDVERATIQQDHTHMCKFENESSPGFDLVAEGIQRYASQALATIRPRWESEKVEQNSKTVTAANELLGGNARGIDYISRRDRHGHATDQLQGIHNTSVDNTKLSESQQKSFYIVPRERVKDFLGREDQLQEIEAFFSKQSSQQPKVLILHALGGQGKSQIALEYCQRSRKQSQYRGIFWINVSSEKLAIQSYTQIAKAVAGFNSASDPDGEQVVPLVKDRLESWSEKCLLVFDNYDQPEKFPRVQKFLPKVEHCHVLFTSRHGELSRLGALMKVPGLSPEEGVTLLLHGHKDSDIETNSVTALKIVERLGNLALAIDQAAAYIRYRRMLPEQLEKFLDIYETQRERILKYTPTDFWEYSTMQIHGEEDQSRAITAFTTWEMSLDQLKSRPSLANVELLRLLTVSSYFNTARIEESLFRDYWEANDDQAQWLGDLGTKYTTAKDELGHDQNNEYAEGAKARSDLSPKANSVAGTSFKRSLKSVSRFHSRSNQKRDNHQPVTKKRSNEWDPDRFWAVLHTLHTSSLVQDLELDAEGAAFSLHPLIRDWLQLREPAHARRRYREESFSVLSHSAIVGRGIGQTTWAQRRPLVAHIDACMSNDERVSMPQDRFGSEIANCGTASTLAIFYRVVGRPKASEEILRRVVERRVAYLGEEHHDLLQSFYDLGTVLYNQDRNREAEQVVRHTLRLRARALGERHPLTLQVMSLLGIILRAQKKSLEAESIFRESLQLQVKISGKEHRDTIPPVLALARSLSYQGKHDEAEELSRHAVRLCEEKFGEEHPQTQEAIQYLASALFEQAKFDEAEARYLQCLHLCEVLYGMENWCTANTLQKLGFVYQKQGNLDDTEAVLRPANEALRDSLGEENRLTQLSTFSLAFLMRDQHKYVEAQMLLCRSLEVQRKSLGRGHADTLETMALLADVLRTQDKHDEADELDRERLELEQMEDE